jgi:hypothetical protein
VFTAALLTIAKLWDQPTCPFMDEWMKKTWYIYTMEYYSAIKKNDMSSAGKWLELEILMLSEISQTEKDKYCFFSHVEFRLRWGKIEGHEHNGVGCLLVAGVLVGGE